MLLKRLRFMVMGTIIGSTIGCFSSMTLATSLIAQSIQVAGNTYTVNVPSGYVFEVLTTKIDHPRMLTFHADIGRPMVVSFMQVIMARIIGGFSSHQNNSRICNKALFMACRGINMMDSR